MTISKEVAHLRARHANAVLRGDEAAAREYRRDLAVQRVEEFVQRTLGDVTLTAEQRARLADLLRTDEVAGGAQ